MSKDLLASKIVVVEEEPRVRGIPSVSTSVTGAIGVTERGPIGKAELCNSFEEFQSKFGGFTPDSDLALAAVGYFENGGNSLWVVRTVHYTDPSDPTTATAAQSSAYLVATMAGDGSNQENCVLVKGKDPGAYANHVEVEVLGKGALGEPDLFDLTVIEDGVFRERFVDLSMNPESERYIEKLVNHQRSGSKLIWVEDLALPGQPTPDFQLIQLSGGDDGLTGLNDADFLGSETSKTGIRALDQVQDLSLLLVPGRATPAVHNAMIQYCEIDRDGMVFAILDPPEGQSATDIVEYVTNTAALQEFSEHAAMYWPRVTILNPARSVFGPLDKIVIPPSGIIAGVYARTDSGRPGGVYDPPAGIDKGRMFGVLGFETNEVLEEVKRDLVYPKRINPLTTGPGLPSYIDGSRTLKSNGNFPYVAERRGVSFIERSLTQGLQFARHKNNTEGLRAQVRRTIASFLITQMNNGAFQSREPAKAFFVDVSDQLNTPSVIFSGKLLVRIGLATNKPAEFIVLSISQDTRALETELVSTVP